MAVTASKTAVFRKLADDLDAALARGDEVGMDLLKSMLPELGEAIEEINEALREIDSLLFEGLRDEAIGLHDPDLATVALRLHLEDKPQWPIAAMYFRNEGIAPPPAIDFIALSALNAAYAEVDRLRKPLDRLRRLALERAPLHSRIALLRKIRAYDPSKPVWGDRLTAHEEVRILELGDAVKQALVKRDPNVIASLHRELTAPDWSIPVPMRLTRETSGADIWSRLRRKMATLEEIAIQFESEFATSNQKDTDLRDRLEELRSLRDKWLKGESRCRDLLFSLPQHPTIMGLASTEDFGQRLETLRQKLAPAVEWLGHLDERDSQIDQFRRACNELEMLTEDLPLKRGEAHWLTRIETLEGDLRRLSQQLPHLRVPESLPLKIDRAVADIRRRGIQRRRNQVAASVLCLIAMAGAIGATAYVIAGSRAVHEACEYAESLITLAEKGEYVVRPELLDTYAARYGSTSRLKASLEEFDKRAAIEQTRRDAFDALLADHEKQLSAAEEALTERAARQEQRLAEWPTYVFDAQVKYRAARLKGGFPARRRFVDASSSNKGNGEADLPPAARQRFEDEETKLAQHEAKQDRVERNYSNAATEEFNRQLKEVEAVIPITGDSEAGQTAKGLLQKLDSLLDEGRSPRSHSVESGKRIAYSTLETAKPIKAQLETLIKTSSR